MTKPGPGEEKINPTDDGDAGVDVLKQKKKNSNLLETVAPTPEKEGRQKPRRDGGVRQAKKAAKSRDRSNLESQVARLLEIWGKDE